MNEVTGRDGRKRGIDAQSAMLLALGWLTALWVTLS